MGRSPLQVGSSSSIVLPYDLLYLIRMVPTQYLPTWKWRRKTKRAEGDTFCKHWSFYFILLRARTMTQQPGVNIFKSAPSHLEL